MAYALRAFIVLVYVAKARSSGTSRPKALPRGCQAEVCQNGEARIGVEADAAIFVAVAVPIQAITREGITICAITIEAITIEGITIYAITIQAITIEADAVISVAVAVPVQAITIEADAAMFVAVTVSIQAINIEAMSFYTITT